MHISGSNYDLTAYELNFFLFEYPYTCMFPTVVNECRGSKSERHVRNVIFNE